MRLVNPVMPTKVYRILDKDSKLIGEMAADTASQALEYATIDWGSRCRIAIISDIKMPGVRKLKY